MATCRTGLNYAIQNYSYNATTGNLSIRAGVNYTYGDTNHDHAVTQMGTDSYSYDNNGNQVTRNVGGSSYTLSYDAENRLVGVTGAATQTFVYDGDGNRVKSTGSYMNLAAGIVPTGDVTINNAAVITDNDTWADNGSQYAYAATTGLHYVKIDLGAIYSVNKIKVWHYANDGRTYHGTKTQVSEDGTNWVTVYDSAVSGEYQETAQGKTITFTAQNVRYVRDYVNGNTVNASDHWTEIEVWGQGTVTYVGNYLEWTGSTNTMEKYYYAGSNRVAVRRGANSLYWLMGDHLGSQAITTDANGGKISEVRYYPWGGDRYYAYTSTTTFRFTGQRTEDYIKLYWYGSRWYDSSSARFIQPDPIIPEAYNTLAYDRYQYVYSNPVRYTDSSGHCIDGITTWACIIFFGGLVLKAIDYGWTAYDAYQSGKVLADPNTSREDKLFAGLNVGLALIFEAGEPDDLLPAGLPLDDVGRRAVMNGAREAFEEGGEAALEKYVRDNLGDYADDILKKMGFNTSNFAGPEKLLGHFQKHGSEFGYKTVDEYLQGARTLIGGGKGIETFTRVNGDKLFYNVATNEFGILTKDGVIRSYFKPIGGIEYWLSQIGK